MADDRSPRERALRLARTCRTQVARLPTYEPLVKTPVLSGPSLSTGSAVGASTRTPPRRFSVGDRLRSAVAAQVEVVQRRDRGAGAGHQVVVVRLVAGHRVGRRLRLRGRLDPDVAVALQAGAGRDQLAEDHVLLQAHQGIRLAVDGGVGEHLGGLLEGGRGQPRVSGQRGLRDAHQDRTPLGGLATLGDDLAVLRDVRRTIDQLTGEHVGVARLQHRHPAQHLADDDLQVLVVDRGALRAVHLLDLVHQVLLHRGDTEHLEHVLRVELTVGQLLADRDVIAVLHQQPGTTAQQHLELLGAVVGHDVHLAPAVGGLQPDPAGGTRDRGLGLRGAGLEELDDTRQTLGDVVAGHTTGVERTHRQLGAGLTDRLGRDDADGLADIDQLAGRERTAVAHRAGAGGGLTGEHRAHLDLGDPVVDEHRDVHVAEVDTGLQQDLTVGVGDVGGQAPGVHRRLDGRIGDEHTVLLDRDPLGQTGLGAAVLLADDHVLGDVDQTTGEVARVGRPQGGVGLALPATVGGDEVLQHGQALTEVGLDRRGDDVALRVGHQASHGGDLTHLRHVPSGTGVHHHVDRVGVREVLLHRLGQLGGRLLPQLDQVGATLLGSGLAALVLLVDRGGLGLVAGDQLRLAVRGLDVRDRHRGARPRGPAEAEVLQVVEGGGDVDLRVALGEVVDDPAQRLLRHLVVDVREVGRQRLVEDGPPEGGRQHDGAVLAQHLALRRDDVAHPDGHLGAELDLPEVEGHPGLGRVAEDTSLTDQAVALLGEEVHADDHVLGRQGDGATVGRLQDVVRRQHQDPGLGLGLRAEREVDGHLVTVEVGVEGRADERVQLDRLALDQLRLERLDTEAVQGRCAVEQHRVFGDDLFEDVPHPRVLALDHPLGGLDVLRMVEVGQPLHHERLEQLQGHRLRQAALVQLELRADHDDRTAGVVDALAQQVLAETTLLALQHVGDRLQRAVARAGHRTATAAVVEQRVDGLLQHPLLVVDDDLGGAKVEQPLEPVVAVDHATVEVVQVRGGEPAAVELHHRAQIRRDDRDGVEDHALRRVAGLDERGHHLEALERAGLPLALAVTDDGAQVLGLGREVEVTQPLLDGGGAHGAGEVLAEPGLHLPVEDLIAFQILDLQALEPVPDGVQPVDLALAAIAQQLDLLLGLGPDLAVHVGRGALGLELLKVLLELAHLLLDGGVALLLAVRLLLVDLRLEGREVAVARLLVDPGDHVRGEVDDLLQVLRRDVEEVAEPARHTLEVPDVRHRGGELDVAHPLTTDVGAGDLDATALTHDALEPDTLVLAAVALPVPGGAEDLLAEQAVPLRLQGAVVDGLRLLHLAV
ncbi:hypothetical protein SDC9_58625 [bioreactor metagenome]|uniref:Uncharacterized protein n=1 Tax=bioreactor metagenome TaxID=1076179 RepID=A0A644XDL0_9ZZZZ